MSNSLIEEITLLPLHYYKVEEEMLQSGAGTSLLQNQASLFQNGVALLQSRASAITK